MTISSEERARARRRKQFIEELREIAEAADESDDDELKPDRDLTFSKSEFGGSNE